MSSLSNYWENKILDWLLRGQALTAPTTLYVALFTASPTDAGGGTEVSTSSTGYARVGIACGLTTLSGTQGAATTVASSGTSGSISNNAAVTFGTPSAAWGTVKHWALYDAASAGNLLVWADLTNPKTIVGTDPAPSFAAGQLVISIDDLPTAGSMSNYLENKVLDYLYRAQAFTPPATTYVGLFTAAPSDAGGGTEVSTASTGYARQAITSGLTAWSGTQGSGTTVASSGTGGTISNNAIVTFGTPTGAWGTCTHAGLFDASSAGNLLFWGALAAAKTVNAGDAAPIHAIGALSIKVDD